jgi:quercetin dioxygenase-like cupin family protein
MTRCTYYRRGGRFGWTYAMAAGESIPRHSHSWEMYHTIECVAGAVSVNGAVLRQGDKMLIDSGVEHGIIALEPSRVFNLLLDGDGGLDYPDGHSVEE